MNNYTYTDLHYLSGSNKWRNSIDKTTAISNDREKTYTLHATGHADATEGRTYIALPKNTKITKSVKKKYNLM